MSKIWNVLFLEERPSIVLSFFRIFVALTAGLHMIPSFFHLAVNEWVRKSPEALVIALVAAFYVTWFCFLIGLFSQLSCILMTVCCYYFYALNSFHIGTLSWDILLVTLFLMCLTPYHGDYFSLDALLRGDVGAWHRTRPFFIQRLLQLQLASTLFFIGLYKINGQDNGIPGNLVYYLMNCPVFFLFPAQLLLFIHPWRVIDWIESRRRYHRESPRPKIIFDGNCGFCRGSIRLLEIMDLWGILEYVPAGQSLGPQGESPLKEMRLDFADGRTYGGFFAFRKLTWMVPMLYPMLPLVYFPGSGIAGPAVYRWVAANRHRFPGFKPYPDEWCRR